MTDNNIDICKDRINVCFLFGGREGGGMAASSLQLVEKINKSKFNVKVLFCEEAGYTVQFRNKKINYECLRTGWPPSLHYNSKKGVKTNWIGFLTMPIWYLKCVIALVKYIRNNNVDIVHTNYHHFHFVAALACGISKSKCVWHWRGVLRWRKMKYLAGVIRWLTSGFIWSIANSTVTAQSVRPFSGNQLSIVYNGVEFKNSGNKLTSIHKLIKVPASSRIVGLVGSLNPIKGHRYFIEAAGFVCVEYENVHFVYIGGQTAAGQHDYYQSLIARRSQLGLESRVHFLGYRPDADLLCSDFDVSVVCTLPPGEGFGLAIIEAMAQGVPVIATDIGAAREIIEDQVTGILVPPGDAGILAEKIKELLENKQKSKELGKNGKNICLERFDIRKTVREVENVYGRILN